MNTSYNKSEESFEVIEVTDNEMEDKKQNPKEEQLDRDSEEDENNEEDDDEEEVVKNAAPNVENPNTHPKQGEEENSHITATCKNFCLFFFLFSFSLAMTNSFLFQVARANQRNKNMDRPCLTFLPFPLSSR